MKKIKTAHVIRVFSYGGAEVLLRECFAHPYFKENVASDLYILDHKKLGLVEEAKPHVNSIRYYKISNWKFFIAYAKFLKHIIAGKYDVVHIHLPAAGWMTIPAKLFNRKTKFVYSEHNLVSFYAKYNYYLSGLAYGFFDCLIYVSHEVGEVVRRVQKGWFFKTKKAVTIPNGINTDKFTNVHRCYNDVNHNFTVGLLARFRPQKRVDRWAEVAAEVHKMNPNIKFLMVGNGPDDEMLRARIKCLNMEGKIELPGMLSDTTSAFKRINIFLLTSDFEGLPLAIIEAMSAGCVPVAGNVGGIKQLPFDGFGYKFDDFNATAIAKVIAAYANDPEKFKTESLQARNFIECNYSLTKQVHEIVALYKALNAEVNLV
ncbi:glycosyltransferase [Parafilimonas sp.]|uniref:glycosyltransferase n=1 Tax=Parafilimonas sp. TaxID=1969739 RepID=UPI0039E66BAE